MKINRHLRLLENLGKEEIDLLNAANKASHDAYSPYSQLKIGAAIFTKAKRLFTGANVENASFGLTICAERTAAAKAVSSGEREFEVIAISSNDAEELIPCGACLQFLSEFAEDIRILIKPSSGLAYASRLSILLPERFSMGSKD